MDAMRVCSAVRFMAVSLYCSTRKIHPKQLEKFLARFEEENSLRWPVDSRCGFWIASDACSSLARVEASEASDFNLLARSQGTDDTVKYGADDGVGLLEWHPNGLVNLFGKIGPDHLTPPAFNHEKEYHRCSGKPVSSAPGSKRAMLR
jgi:hypothetical protein